MSNWREVKESDTDTIINMNNVAFYGFKVMEYGVYVNITFVGGKVAVFPYSDIENCAIDWPELEKPIRAWIKQGLG